MRLFVVCYMTVKKVKSAQISIKFVIMSLEDKMVAPHQLLIVGAGLTGSVTASLLRRKFPKDLLNITVWEKSRGAGGRMNTNRRPTDPKATIDLGAQYISATSEHYARNHHSFYQELLSAKVLVPFTGVIEGEKEAAKHDFTNFVAPAGINTIVKHFLHSSESKVSYETHCSAVNCYEKPGNDGLTRKVWSVTDVRDHAADFDSVIITIPVPQLLGLNGNIQDFLETKRPSLENVEYSSRFAVGLYFEAGAEINVPWTCKYTVGDPNLAFISVDTRKRSGKDPTDIGPSLLIHASKSFSLKHWDTDQDSVKNLIISQVKQIIPDLPQPIDSRCIRWRYSQVVRGFEGAPGCLVLSSSPLLIACGDAFTHTNFDGCVSSAQSVAEAFHL